MDPRLLASVSLDPRIPSLADHRLPSEGVLPQHFYHQEQHLGSGLPLRGSVLVGAALAAPLASYSAVAPPPPAAASSSLSSGHGYHTVESLLGANTAPPQPRAVSGDANRLLGGVAAPPGYKLVPVGQEGYERASALQQGYERAPAVQQGYERVPAVQQGYERVSVMQQGYERVPAVQQQGYERVPAMQKQGLDAFPTEYSYPGVKPLANAGMVPPGARQVNRIAGRPPLRDVYLSPPRLPPLHSQPELPLLIRRPVYRYVRGQVEEPVPMYGRTREVSRAWGGRADLVRDRPRPSQLPRFERPRKKARLSKNESSAATAKAEKSSPERGPGWCSVCQINCDTVNILKQHLAGKRHKKQLDKKNEDSQVTNKNSDNQAMDVHEGQESTEGKASLAAVVAKAIDSKKKRKRHREKGRWGRGAKELLEGSILNGEQNESVKSDDGKKPDTFEKCEVCNVTCSNRAALQAHFAGKRHAARIKKLLNKDVTPKSNGKLAAANGTNLDTQAADLDVNPGEEESTGIVSGPLQEIAADTEPLVAVKEPVEKPSEEE